MIMLSVNIDNDSVKIISENPFIPNAKYQLEFDVDGCYLIKTFNNVDTLIDRYNLALSHVKTQTRMATKQDWLIYKLFCYINALFTSDIIKRIGDYNG